MSETETIETEPPVEEVHDPAAVLRKNRELLGDLAKLRDRTAALEDAARALGIGDEDLADPRAFVTKRAEERKAADARAGTIREAALRAIAAEGRHVKGDLDEVLAKLAADPGVTIDKDGKVSGLLTALGKLAPKRPAPGLPSVHGYATPAKSDVKTWEELQASGHNTVARFAAERPERYEELRADWQRRLANPGAR